MAMVRGMSEVELISDRRTQRATERSFEIIGEASLASHANSQNAPRPFPTIDASSTFETCWPMVTTSWTLDWCSRWLGSACPTC